MHERGAELRCAEEGRTAVELVAHDLDHLEKVTRLLRTTEVRPLQVVELLDQTRLRTLTKSSDTRYDSEREKL